MHCINIKNQKMLSLMILLSMLKLVVICLSLFLANACEDSINTVGCYFTVTNQSADCNTFTFVCCQQRRNTYNNWDTCMDICCSSSGPQTYDTLN